MKTVLNQVKCGVLTVTCLMSCSRFTNRLLATALDNVTAMQYDMYS